jgi:betaine-aldehyde dehydrogenase
MPSAKLDVAARGAAFAAFINCGQVCTSTEKLIVHTDIYDEFMRLFTGHVAALRQGHPLDKVDVGPMENGRELARLESIIARAVEQGATVTIGGGRPALGDSELATGFFHEPTILENVNRDMDIYQQEIFGPAVAVYRVSSFDEALDLANGSPFGLGSNLYSTDVVEIDRAVNEIVAGMVWVNAPLLDNDAGPFGGRKMSGIGRQLGAEGLDTFRHTKFMMVDAHSSEQNFWWFPYSDDEAFE